MEILSGMEQQNNLPGEFKMEGEPKKISPRIKKRVSRKIGH
jgi:hypothetical protein